MGRIRFAQIPTVLLSDTSLSIGARLLYAVLDYYGGATGEAWPGEGTLAQHLGCSTRQVRRYVKELVDAGAIEMIRRFNQTNFYRLPLRNGDTSVLINRDISVPIGRAGDEDTSVRRPGHHCPPNKRTLTGSDQKNPAAERSQLSTFPAVPPGGGTPTAPRTSEHQELIDRIDVFSADALAVLVHRWPFHASPYDGPLNDSDMTAALEAVWRVEGMTQADISSYLERNL